MFTHPLRAAAVAALSVLFVVQVDVQAQRLRDRIRTVQDQQRAQVDRHRVRSQAILQRGLGSVNLRDISARDAFEWVSTVSGMPIIVNWNDLKRVGIDRKTPIDLYLPTEMQHSLFSHRAHNSSISQTLRSPFGDSQ